MCTSRFAVRFRTFRFAFAMRRRDLSSYDVLHAHGEDYWMWRRRVPMHVRTLHGSCFEEALRIRGVKEKARMVLLGFTEVLASIVADRTVLISPGTRRWTPWVKTVIPNGVDTARFAPEPARASTPRRPCCSSAPGVDASTVPSSRRCSPNDVRAARAGRGAADGHAGCARPVSPRVSSRSGRLDDDALADEYRRAWVFCLPSSYEGFGIPYAEAMAAGLPVVATPNVGARFVTDEGRYGALAPLDDLAAPLTELADRSARA